MKDQKDKRCRFIFYSHFWSYLPGVPLILSMSVVQVTGNVKPWSW